MSVHEPSISNYHETNTVYPSLTEAKPVDHLAREESSSLVEDSADAVLFTVDMSSDSIESECEDIPVTSLKDTIIPSVEATSGVPLAHRVEVVITEQFTDNEDVPAEACYNQVNSIVDNFVLSGGEALGLATKAAVDHDKIGSDVNTRSEVENQNVAEWIIDDSTNVELAAVLEAEVINISDNTDVLFGESGDSEYGYKHVGTHDAEHPLFESVEASHESPPCDLPPVDIMSGGQKIPDEVVITTNMSLIEADDVEADTNEVPILAAADNNDTDLSSVQILPSGSDQVIESITTPALTDLKPIAVYQATLESDIIGTCTPVQDEFTEGQDIEWVESTEDQVQVLNHGLVESEVIPLVHEVSDDLQMRGRQDVEIIPDSDAKAGVVIKEATLVEMIDVPPEIGTGVSVEDPKAEVLEDAHDANLEGEDIPSTVSVNDVTVTAEAAIDGLIHETPAAQVDVLLLTEQQIKEDVVVPILLEASKSEGPVGKLVDPIMVEAPIHDANDAVTEDIALTQLDPEEASSDSIAIDKSAQDNEQVPSYFLVETNRKIFVDDIVPKAEMGVPNSDIVDDSLNVPQAEVGPVGPVDLVDDSELIKLDSHVMEATDVAVEPQHESVLEVMEARYSSVEHVEEPLVDVEVTDRGTVMQFEVTPADYVADFEPIKLDSHVMGAIAVTVEPQHESDQEVMETHSSPVKHVNAETFILEIEDSKPGVAQEALVVSQAETISADSVVGSEPIKLDSHIMEAIQPQYESDQQVMETHSSPVEHVEEPLVTIEIPVLEIEVTGPGTAEQYKVTLADSVADSEPIELDSQVVEDIDAAVEPQHQSVLEVMETRYSPVEHVEEPLVNAETPVLEIEVTEPGVVQEALAVYQIEAVLADFVPCSESIKLDSQDMEDIVELKDASVLDETGTLASPVEQIEEPRVETGIPVLEEAEDALKTEQECSSVPRFEEVEDPPTVQSIQSLGVSAIVNVELISKLTEPEKSDETMDEQTEGPLVETVAASSLDDAPEIVAEIDQPAFVEPEEATELHVAGVLLSETDPADLLEARRMESERPMSPWTPSYSVSTQGGLSDGEPEIEESLQLPTVVVIEDDTLYGATEDHGLDAPEHTVVADSHQANNVDANGSVSDLVETSSLHLNDDHVSSSVAPNQEGTPEDQFEADISISEEANVDTLLIDTDGGVEEEPKSPWTPSYPVTTLHVSNPRFQSCAQPEEVERFPLTTEPILEPETSPSDLETRFDDKSLIDDLQINADEVRIDHLPMEQIGAVMVAEEAPSTEPDMDSPSINIDSSTNQADHVADEIPKAPWMPSYSVTTLHEITPIVEPKSDPEEVLVDPMPQQPDAPVIVESLSYIDHSEAIDIPDYVMSHEPLVVETTETQLEPEILVVPGDGDAEVLTTVAEESEEAPRSPWTPSYSVTTLNALDSQIETRLDNITATEEPEQFVEDDSIMIALASTDALQLQVDESSLSQDGIGTANEGYLPGTNVDHVLSNVRESELYTQQGKLESPDDIPKRPWTPSYSSYTQGFGIDGSTENDKDSVNHEPMESRGDFSFNVEEISHTDTSGAYGQDFPKLTDSLDTLSDKPVMETLQPKDPESVLSIRTRYESTASSRFLPGGWFTTSKSPTDEGRTSLDAAVGEFVANKSVATGPKEPAVEETSEEFQESEEKKSRWCHIM